MGGTTRKLTASTLAVLQLDGHEEIAVLHAKRLPASTRASNRDTVLMDLGLSHGEGITKCFLPKGFLADLCQLEAEGWRPRMSRRDPKAYMSQPARKSEVSLWLER